MSDEEKIREEGVFKQELSTDDLEASTGAGLRYNPAVDCGHNVWDHMYQENCMGTSRRKIYGGNGFSNCAATVESGSFCNSNDACYSDSVKYTDLTSCSKAWR